MSEKSQTKTSRVKITLTDEEKALLEQEAREAGMPTATYLKWCIDNRHTAVEPAREPISFPFDRKDLRKNGTNLHLRIPKSLNRQIRETAKSHGLTISDYIVWLITQKGTPVDLQVDLPGRAMFSQKLNDLMEEVAGISDTVSRTQKIYPSELRIVMDDLRQAIAEFSKEAARRDRDFTKEIDRLRDEINEIKSAPRSSPVPSGQPRPPQ